MARLLAFLCAFALSLVGSAALAQPEFPERGTSPVLDLANVIDETDEALLTERLDAFEQSNQRQFVVVTVPSLDGYEISDYGYQLGRAWGLGDEENDDGIILLIAPNERRVRIEVGYGLESVIPDGLAYDIIEREIVPRFKQDDMTGGIVAGAEAIMRHLELPAEEQQAAIQQATATETGEDGGFPFGVLIWLGFLFIFVILPMLARAGRGRRYRRSGVAGAVGEVLLWTAINAAMNKGGGGSSWGGGSGGGFGGFGGGGGFSGGGGSFGGGGASGSW